MIFVDRNLVSSPNILTEYDDKGLKEQTKAIAFYSDSNNALKAFKFEVYKDKSIKNAFNQLFHNKCAYCESNYAKVHPVDVEHYRPKGGVIVNGKIQKPGYYWLGSDWKNLLPSCIDCNRQRTHEIDHMELELLGKANLFPIVNESERANKPGYENYEKRLLLDPCRDNPEEHLEFFEDGRVEGLSFSGIVSIDTYGLKRKSLVEAREAKAKEINLNINRIKWFLGQIEVLSEAHSEEFINGYFDQLKIELRNLKSFMDSKKEYSALARQLIKPFLDSFFKRLD